MKDEEEMFRRRAMALQLRGLGKTYDEIAEEMQIPSPEKPNRGAAYVLVQAALQDIIREPAEEVRVLELLRLDKAVELVMAHIEGGNLKAIPHLIQLMDRRAKYLGLDSPIKIDIPTLTSPAMETMLSSAEGALLVAQAESFMAANPVSGAEPE